MAQHITGSSDKSPNVLLVGIVASLAATAIVLIGSWAWNWLHPKEPRLLAQSSPPIVVSSLAVHSPDLTLQWGDESVQTAVFFAVTVSDVGGSPIYQSHFDPALRFLAPSGFRIVRAQTTDFSRGTLARAIQQLPNGTVTLGPVNLDCGDFVSANFVLVGDEPWDTDWTLGLDGHIVGVATPAIERWQPTRADDSWNVLFGVLVALAAATLTSVITASFILASRRRLRIQALLAEHSEQVSRPSQGGSPRVRRR